MARAGRTGVAVMGRLLTLAALIFLIAARRAVPVDSGPGTGFQGSAHDFSGEAAGSDQRTGHEVKSGPCTFCHTPHKAYGTRLLWNHTYSANTYTWTEVTHTTGGTRLPTIRPDWTGPTVYCLSCHDGTVAVGDIAWFNRQAWGGGRALDQERHASGSKNIASTAGNMRGNHPVAHPYPFQRTLSTYNQTTTGDGVDLRRFNPDPTSRGIRLFNDASGIVIAEPVTGRTGIECSSCHGVHNERGVVRDSKLLRGTRNPQEPDYLCTKCHSNLLEGNPHR